MAWALSEEDLNLYAEASALGADTIVLSTKKSALKFVAIKNEHARGEINKCSRL